MRAPKKQAVPVAPAKPPRKPPKSRVGGTRLLVEGDWPQINAAAAAAGKNFSDWSRDGLLELSDPNRIDYRALLLKYMQCCVACDGGLHIMSDEDSLEIMSNAEYKALCSLGDSGSLDCHRAARSLVQKISCHPEAMSPPIVESESLTCNDCGHAREVRRIHQFNGPSLPGEDPGCQRCAENDSLMRLKGLAFMSGAIQSWPSEFSAMDQMDPTEAMGRFKELLNGRPLPKGFTKLPRPEQIRWLEKEMPL